MPKSELNSHDQSDRVRSMMKTREDNDVIDCIGAVYDKIGVDLSWLIQKNADYHQKQSR